MSTTPNVTDLLRAAIAARKDSLIALRSRIVGLLADVPIGTSLSDKQGLVCRVARICTGASQWSNRTWDVTIKGRGYITDTGRLLATEIDESKWDGSNMHHHSSEPIVEGSNAYAYYSRDADDRGLLFASGKDTRALAARLAAALERYMMECQTEQQANDATLIGREAN